MTHFARRTVDSSPDKTGQGHLYSTLRLPKTPNHAATHLSDPDDSDSSDGETSYSASPSPTTIHAKVSPTACTTLQTIPGSIRDETTPATVVEAFVFDMELVEGAEETSWRRHVNSEDWDGSTHGPAVKAVEDPRTNKDDGSPSATEGGCRLLRIYQLDDARDEHTDDYGSDIDHKDSEVAEDDANLLGMYELHDSDLGQCTPFTTEHPSPASESHLADAALELAPLRCSTCLWHLQSLADPSEGKRLDSEEDEQSAHDDGLASLSPLTELSSPVNFPAAEENDTASLALHQLDEAHAMANCLFSPLPSPDYLADILSPGVPCTEDTELEHSVRVFFLWSASPCACCNEGRCFHVDRI